MWRCVSPEHARLPRGRRASQDLRLHVASRPILNSLFFEDAPGGDEGCGERVERILEFSSELQEIVEAYHY